MPSTGVHGPATASALACFEDGTSTSSCFAAIVPHLPEHGMPCKCEPRGNTNQGSRQARGQRASALRGALVVTPAQMPFPRDNPSCSDACSTRGIVVCLSVRTAGPWCAADNGGMAVMSKQFVAHVATLVDTISAEFSQCSRSSVLHCTSRSVRGTAIDVI